jgi:hypothetical protein
MLKPCGVGWHQKQAVRREMSILYSLLLSKDRHEYSRLCSKDQPTKKDKITVPFAWVCVTFL